MSFEILLIQYFFLHIFLTKVTGILKFFSTSNFSFSLPLQHSKIPVENTTHDSMLSKSNLLCNKSTTVDDDSIRGGDLELLMADLGVFCHPGVEKLPEVLNFANVYNVFEVEQPRLSEVKEAFDVFDENKDGFIDAGELQRVLSVLGLKGRADMEDCRRMIGAFDENADGRIDFNEFVKFMDSTFC